MEKIFSQLEKLATEQRNPVSMEIDSAPTEKILTIINNEDKKVATAVESQLSFIAEAVELIVNSLTNNGRLIYVGAGTSGRLGVLDAAECPPTFGTNSETIQGIIAGGKDAMFRAIEGAEDNEENGAKAIEALNVSSNDVVCGIAASLRTPFVIGAVKRAKQLNAHTVYLTTNPRTKFELPEFSDLISSIDVAICPEVGPEVIMGSTRMKSGTAQKLVLNMLTTAAMIRLGKVYENMMIDLQATNIKLVERAKRVVMTVTGAEYNEAEKILAQSKGNVKIAIVMKIVNVDYGSAVEKLRVTRGFVRAAIENK
jgi:N-acetylmuramic acid 6-phosphate etherase